MMMHRSKVLFTWEVKYRCLFFLDALLFQRKPRFFLYFTVSPAGLIITLYSHLHVITGLEFAVSGFTPLRR